MGPGRAAAKASEPGTLVCCRLQDQRGNELQAAMQQVTFEAGRASQAQTDLMTCRAACRRLEEQVAESSQKYGLSAKQQLTCMHALNWLQ